MSRYCIPASAAPAMGRLADRVAAQLPRLAALAQRPHATGYQEAVALEVRQVGLALAEAEFDLGWCTSLAAQRGRMEETIPRLPLEAAKSLDVAGVWLSDLIEQLQGVLVVIMAPSGAPWDPTCPGDVNATLTGCRGLLGEIERALREVILAATEPTA